MRNFEKTEDEKALCLEKLQKGLIRAKLSGKYSKEKIEETQKLIDDYRYNQFQFRLYNLNKCIASVNKIMYCPKCGELKYKEWEIDVPEHGAYCRNCGSTVIRIEVK